MAPLIKTIAAILFASLSLQCAAHTVNLQCWQSGRYKLQVASIPTGNAKMTVKNLGGSFIYDTVFNVTSNSMLLSVRQPSLNTSVKVTIIWSDNFVNNVTTNSVKCSVTAIDFTSQYLKMVSSKPTLFFTTANSTNTSKFELLRNGVVIATKQFRNNFASYSMTDENPLEGNNLYQIREVDYDGSYSFSKAFLYVRNSAKTAKQFYTLDGKRLLYKPIGLPYIETDLQYSQIKFTQ